MCPSTSSRRAGFCRFAWHPKKIRGKFPSPGPAHHRRKMRRADSKLSYMLQSRCYQKVMAAFVENP